jgi:heme/copper-type cytochrome/quinol oxidase subunit 2
MSLAAMLAPLPLSAPAAQAHTIDVNARQFAFEPASLRVQRGDTVTIHFESLDAAHGLFIDGYGVDLHAELGKSAETTFVASEAGKFKIRCSVSCGVLHPFMIGELEVDPYWPLGRALTAMVVVAGGALAFFWKRE